ncbi:hypothetical protein, partial [Allomesorhizobium alhagi]
GVVEAIEIAEAPLSYAVLFGDSDHVGQDALGGTGLAAPDLSCFEPFDDNRLRRFVGAIQLIRP